ncbi:hypothetical protein [Dactylosporangium sp. CA-139066]|uniref:hypothetical protein n=1 Tax=Dactylosporangium sp. CA-139066 TaxID=3239930 RepID=UPI003D8A1425
MDETGQAGSPDVGGAYAGANPGAIRGRSGYPDGHVNGGSPSDDALEAIVSAWREPATGAIAGRATVNGNGLNTNGLNGNGMNGNGLNGNGMNGNGMNGNGGSRGRAEVRSPYSDMLAPMSPPVSAPPPAQPPTSTLHYGHYAPDGQGWSTSSATGETKSVPAPPMPGTVYGALSGVDHEAPPAVAPLHGPQPPFGVQPLHGPQPPFDVQPLHGPQPPFDEPQQYQVQAPQPAPSPYGYEQPPSALDRVAEQQAHQADQWGYQFQQYQQPEPPYQPQPEPPYQQKPEPAYHQPEPPYQQPEQRHWAPEPAQPEFDWAAPVQHPPVQHEPQPAPAPAAPPQNAAPTQTQRAPQAQPLPTQRVPEDDPLVGPLPPVLLGSSTSLSAGEPQMPSFADAIFEPTYEAPELPQRVPSEPDVPPVPAVEPQSVAVGAPELTRITNKLREDEDFGPESPDERPDGFDVQSVLRAVQAVSGVSRATLRKNADGLHTLRLELADEADAGQVSRIVARMLNDTMGLSAEQNPLLPDDGEPDPLAGIAGPLAPTLGGRPAVRNTPHSALPGSGREARRRRPVSSAGSRRPTESKPPALTPNPGAIVSPRVVIESVDVNTQGIDATVEVRLTADNHPAIGVASGPNFDGYMLKLAALAAASAVDQLLIDSDATVRARCYIEHAAVVALGGCEVAVVVLLLMYDGFVEQLTGSAVVSGDGDSRQAVVRATLAAVNRRLEALLP